MDPKINMSVAIQFGIGDLAGFFWQDRCMMGDVNDTSKQLVLDDFIFGYTERASVFVGEFQAVVGMAYGKLNGRKGDPEGLTAPPFFD